MASDWSVASEFAHTAADKSQFIFPSYLQEFVYIHVVPQFATDQKLAAQQRILQAFLSDVFVRSPETPQISVTWTDEDQETQSQSVRFFVEFQPPPADDEWAVSSQVSSLTVVLQATHLTALDNFFV